MALDLAATEVDAEDLDYDTYVPGEIEGMLRTVALRVGGEDGRRALARGQAFLEYHAVPLVGGAAAAAAAGEDNPHAGGLVGKRVFRDVGDPAPRGRRGRRPEALFFHGITERIEDPWEEGVGDEEGHWQNLRMESLGKEFLTTGKLRCLLRATLWEEELEEEEEEEEQEQEEEEEGEMKEAMKKFPMKTGSKQDAMKKLPKKKAMKKEPEKRAMKKEAKKKAMRKETKKLMRATKKGTSVKGSSAAMKAKKRKPAPAGGRKPNPKPKEAAMKVAKAAAMKKK